MVPILLLHIALALPPAGLTPDARRTALAEIAAIWSAHGVLVSAAGAPAPGVAGIPVGRNARVDPVRRDRDAGSGDHAVSRRAGGDDRPRERAGRRRRLCASAAARSRDRP